MRDMRLRISSGSTTGGLSGSRMRSSSFTSTIASGTKIYVQVDSANSDTTYGAILETHEQSGQPYNNIRGPQTTTQPIVIPDTPGDAARPDAALPARPDSANR